MSIKRTSRVFLLVVAAALFAAFLPGTAMGAPGPEVSEELAKDVSPNSATLQATIDTGGYETWYGFKYGTTTEYGSSVAGSIPPYKWEPVVVEQKITGLSPDTTYHFQIGAWNGIELVFGTDHTFTTPPTCKGAEGKCSWSISSTPNPTPPPKTLSKAKLEAVSCPSAGVCLAAGLDENSGKGFGQLWNGSEWKAAPYLKEREIKPKGITCVSTTYCVVVGSIGSGAASTAKAEYWAGAGGEWFTGTFTMTQPEAASYVTLNDVACTSTSACTAVGSYYSEKESKTRTLAMRLSGSKWSIQTTANPESGAAQLLGVSCDSATSCTAVGKKESETFAEHWDGTSWSISTTPNPSGAGNSTLVKVSCTSASNCMAVGSYRKTGENNRRTLTERWNGSSWSVVSSPNPAVNYGATLLSVSCSPWSSSCTAVGRYVSAAEFELEGAATEEKTLIESWNGSEWAIQSSPNPEGRKFSILNSVSCPSLTRCMAVGSARGAAETVTLAERYE
jgi:hypothetical protein